MSKCQDNSTTVLAKIVRANKNRLKYNFLTVCMVRLLWGTRYSCRGEVTFPSRLSFASSCPGGTPLIFLRYNIATNEHCCTIILSRGNTPDIPMVQNCYKGALQYHHLVRGEHPWYSYSTELLLMSTAILHSIILSAKFVYFAKIFWVYS